ncbi:MAG TPA: hypothetical protein VJX16_26305 [Terriglobales bacterium]|nr:hypothetical protein [Terriglobales bacterium]
MRGKAVVIFAVLFAFVCWNAQLASAQESAPSSKTNSSAAAKPKPEPAPGGAYRLDFSVNELEDLKKVNTRQYSLNLNAGDANEVKIGTRVPVEFKQGEFQYLDVGTKIWCRLGEQGEHLVLTVHGEITNFASPDQQGKVMPLMRQLAINASTLTMPGKAMVIGSVDDPNSKRQFQLEVTVTKLK